MRNPYISREVVAFPCGMGESGWESTHFLQVSDLSYLAGFDLPQVSSASGYFSGLHDCSVALTFSVFQSSYSSNTEN